MDMDKRIFLPSDEQATKMIIDAWDVFKKQFAENGLELSNERLEGFAQDMFVAGYCAGHNDCLDIIRGQLEAMNMVNDIFNGQTS